MFDDVDLHAILNDIHRAIEESAAKTACDLIEGSTEPCYPPNHGFEADELEALRSIPKTPATERAIRKLLADAAAYPIFHLLCLMDGVADAPEVEVIERDESVRNLMLHDAFYESYWAWRRRRPDPGWRLDVYQG